MIKLYYIPGNGFLHNFQICYQFFSRKDLNDILRTADQLRIRGLTTSTNTKDASNRHQSVGSKRPIASAAVISEKHEDEDEDGKIIEAGDEGDSDPEVLFRQSQSNPNSAQIQSNSMPSAVVSSLRAVRTGSRASQGSLREGIYISDAP